MSPAPETSSAPVVWIHREAPAKPALGAPCNGCGICCLVEPCPVGMVVSGRRRGACKALRWDAVQLRYLCGMVTAPADVLSPRWRWIALWIGRRARRWIAAGQGCDADLDASRG